MPIPHHLDPEKRARLLEFLGSLPAGAAAKLFATIEHDRARGGAGLPHGLLLEALRKQLFDRDAAFPARPLTAQRAFFTPFEDFFIASRQGRKRRARIARGSIAPLWALIVNDPACSGAARAVEALDAAIRDGSQNIETFEEAMFNAAGQGVGRLLAHAESEPAFRSDLDERLGGGGAIHDLAEIHLLLHGVDHLKAMQAAFPKPVAALTEEELFDMRRLYLAAVSEAPDVAPYLLLALVGRLDAPWRALRVYYHLRDSRDDGSAAAREGAAVIVETLFDDLESAARLLERDAEGDLHTDDAGLRVAHFAEFAEGLAEEARRAGDNVVLNRVEAGRDVAGETLARFAEQSLAVIRRAMPVRHAGGSSRLAGLRPDYGRVMSPRGVAEAREAAAFLAGAEAVAARLGRPQNAEGIVADAARELARYAQDLVIEIRAAEGDDRALARRLMAAVLEIAAPLLPAGDLGLIRERANAAALTA